MDIIHVSRYEFKYLLNADEAPDVRRFLLQYCSPDENAGTGWYGIQSLYLDTPEGAFYRASIEKAAERLKLRVRGYSAGNGAIKLEIKRRVGDLVSKRSFTTSREVWSGFKSNGMWSVADGNHALLPFVGFAEQMRASPKVLISYERHALYSRVDDYVRVTFDRRIRCQRMRAWSLNGDPRGWLSVDDPASQRDQERSTYVLELKFKIAPPAWLRDMVREFGLVRRGFSKFSRSVTRIKTDREPAWDLRTHEAVPARAWRIA